MNKQTYYKVGKDMDLSLLMQLRAEGRLYFVSSSEELVQDAIVEVLHELRKTYEYASAEYEDNMENIFRSIFSIHSIRERLVYMHGRQVRKANYGFVACILKFLVLRNCFICNFNDLLRKMFGNTNHNKNVNKACYAFTDDEEKSIKAILLNFSSRLFKP